MEPVAKKFEDGYPGREYREAVKALEGIVTKHFFIVDGALDHELAKMARNYMDLTFFMCDSDAEMSVAEYGGIPVDCSSPDIMPYQYDSAVREARKQVKSDEVDCLHIHVPREDASSNALVAALKKAYPYSEVHVVTPPLDCQA